MNGTYAIKTIKYLVKREKVNMSFFIITNKLFSFFLIISKNQVQFSPLVLVWKNLTTLNKKILRTT
jgi:hypothetical protein